MEVQKHVLTLNILPPSLRSVVRMFRLQNMFLYFIVRTTSSCSFLTTWCCMRGRGSTPSPDPQPRSQSTRWASSSRSIELCLPICSSRSSAFSLGSAVVDGPHNSATRQQAAGFAFIMGPVYDSCWAKARAFGRNLTWKSRPEKRAVKKWTSGGNLLSTRLLILKIYKQLIDLKFTLKNNLLIKSWKMLIY